MTHQQAGTAGNRPKRRRTRLGWQSTRTAPRLGCTTGPPAGGGHGRKPSALRQGCQRGLARPRGPPCDKPQVGAEAWGCRNCSQVGGRGAGRATPGSGWTGPGRRPCTGEQGGEPQGLAIHGLPEGNPWIWPRGATSRLRFLFSARHIDLMMVSNCPESSDTV